MSFAPKQLKDKHCFVYCGPERCDCKAGHGIFEPLLAPSQDMGVAPSQEEATIQKGHSPMKQETRGTYEGLAEVENLITALKRDPSYVGNHDAVYARLRSLATAISSLLEREKELTSDNGLSADGVVMALVKRVEELTAALEPFVIACGRAEHWAKKRGTILYDDDLAILKDNITVGDLRRARALYRKEDGMSDDREVEIWRGKIKGADCSRPDSTLIRLDGPVPIYVNGEYALIRIDRRTSETITERPPQ